MSNSNNTTRKVTRIFRKIMQEFSPVAIKHGVWFRLILQHSGGTNFYTLVVENEFMQGAIASYVNTEQTLWINNSDSLASKSAVLTRHIAANSTYFNELFNITDNESLQSIKVDSYGMTQSEWERKYRNAS